MYLGLLPNYSGQISAGLADVVVEVVQDDVGDDDHIADYQFRDDMAQACVETVEELIGLDAGEAARDLNRSRDWKAKLLISSKDGFAASSIQILLS